MHIFVHRETPYLFQDKETSDWMSRHFFSGGIMPSDDLPLRFQRDLQLVRQWRWNGQHYEKTANAWLENMDTNKAEAMEIMDVGLVAPCLRLVDREDDGVLLAAQFAGDRKVLVSFILSDLYPEVFTYKKGEKAGETGISLKARLLRIGWAKIDGEPLAIEQAA